MQPESIPPTDAAKVAQLAEAVLKRGPYEAFELLEPESDAVAFVVLLGMMASCTVSGVSGAIVSLTLRRLGADPATASSIFLTTATDVVSMGTFLSLATWLVL